MKEKQFIIEFIELYRTLPALWDVKTEEYSDRVVKNIQYEKLLIKYKERYPHARKKELTKKINSLRTNYRRELRRVTSLEESGTEMTVSNLFYFDAMSFLRDNENPCALRSSIKGTNDIQTKTRKKCATVSKELIKLATERLKQPKDEYDSVCETWAAKLRKMSDGQRIFAEIFVNDILFEGQLGTLHRHAIQLHALNRSCPTNAVENDFGMISPSSQTLSSEADIKIKTSDAASYFRTFK